MTIKTYRGRTMSEALLSLKQELGRDAVILNTRTFQTGGVFGLGRKTMTEIVATTPEAAGRAIAARKAAKPASRPATAAAGANQAEPRQKSASVTYSPPAPAGTARHQAVAVMPAPEAPVAAADAPFKQMAKMIMAASSRTPVEEELASIKRMVGQVLQSAKGSHQGAMPDTLFDYYRRMLEAEVASEIADEVSAAVRHELDPAALNDAGTVHQAVVRKLAGYIQVTGDAGKIARGPDGRPLTIALVGPTGVGKTTTIAKLAATYKLRQGRRVGLITCDTYRIAAVEQLRTYADIISLPLKVAMTPAEVRAACMNLSECDAILIDTPGRSPRDTGRIEELQALIDAANPHQRHLVLAGTSSESVMTETASAFAPIGYDRVILTKLDEAVNFGVLVNVARRLQTRLSYVTTGQEVPDQIEASNADRLARIILSPEAVR